MWAIFGILPALNFMARKKQKEDAARKADQDRQNDFMRMIRGSQERRPAGTAFESNRTGYQSGSRSKSDDNPSNSATDMLNPMNIASPLSPLHAPIFYPSPSPAPERNYDCAPAPSHSSSHSSSHDHGSNSSSDYSSSSSSCDSSSSSSGGSDW